MVVSRGFSIPGFQFPIISVSECNSQFPNTTPKFPNTTPSFRIPVSEYHFPVSEYHCLVSEYHCPVSEYHFPVSEYHFQFPNPSFRIPPPVSEYRSPVSEYHRDSLQCMLLYGSLREDLESCGYPSELLSEAWAWSGTGPCEKIFWRSCWNPLQQFLALRSCKCSALVLEWEFFWDAHKKFLYGDLLRSST